MARTLCFGLLLLGLLGVCPGAAWAANAYVQFKGKGNAPYITNLKFHYALMPGPIEEVIVVIPDRPNTRNTLCPRCARSNFCRWWVKKRCAPCTGSGFTCACRALARSLPHALAGITGRLLCAPWTFPVDYDRGYDENAEELQEIRVAPAKPGSSVMSSKFSYTIFKKLIEIIIFS